MQHAHLYRVAFRDDLRHDWPTLPHTYRSVAEAARAVLSLPCFGRFRIAGVGAPEGDFVEVESGERLPDLVIDNGRNIA